MITEQDLSEAQNTIITAIRNGVRFLAGGCGVGKTIASLYAFSDVKTILVLTPKFLRDTKSWSKDLSKITRDLEVTHLSKEDFKKEHHSLGVYDVVILDEACEWLTSGVRPEQRISKHIPYIDTSDIYQCVHEYLQEKPPEYILLIDATPLLNKPLAAWAAMDILGLLQTERIASHQWFVEKFYTPLKKGYATFWKEKTIPSRHCSKAETEQAQKDILYVWKKIAVFVDDDAKIPPIEEDIFVPMTPELKAILDEVAGEYSGNPSLNGRLFGAQNSHRSFIEFNDDKHTMSIERKQVPSNKLDAVVQLLNEKKPPHGVLIFSTFTEQQKAVVTTLQSRGKIVGHVNGQTKSKNRESIMNAFNDGDVDVLVVQSGICAGYNVPNCDTIIRLSAPIKAASLEQQYGRIDRKSNYKQNYIYNIILKANSKYRTDEDAWQRVKAGEDLSDMAYETE